MTYFSKNLMLICSLSFVFTLQAQTNKQEGNLVYVDAQGVLRYTATKQEASFFGVNYTTPFAHAYRAHKVLGVDIEKAIQQDVYHLARLGLNAFRIHIWDTEISDTVGNLIENDKLRLFDFLVAELKKRNIKTVITPIAFWGNGYPERDEATPGFSRKYGKGRATTNDTAIRAQENYIQQLFKHVNPYTKLSYTADPDVIAVELNNEPSHGGPKPGVTNYINRLAASLRSTGWTKPVYYNISQSPFYADAVAKANIDGVSFQWYPTGLVANQEVRGNFLPHVNNYSIPYDTIPEYRTKSKMIYEFDAADVLQSYIYPAMAKSFREAGFQWATQFAYDPIAIAYANTEYQTHYLNLAYTPSKAISFMIAGEVFHKVPRLKDFGTYPADSSFDVFRLSYRESLSEMNTPQKFYYSNSTTTLPVNETTLQAIAGVGSSPLVQYTGHGAYFLDKIEDGVWRLELMPDAVSVRDPFERASLQKEVTQIVWNNNVVKIKLNNLGAGFTIKGINDGNSFSGNASGDSILLMPGTYLLTKSGKRYTNFEKRLGVIALKEFEAPKPRNADVMLRHEPLGEVSAGKTLRIRTKITNLDTGRATLQISRFGGAPTPGGGPGGGQRSIIMTRLSPVDFIADVPAEFLIPGILNYKIIVQKGNNYVSFPGNIKGNPFAWDNYQNETWKTFIAPETGRLEILNPTVDRPDVYTGFRRGFQSVYIPGEQPGRLNLKLSATELAGDHTMGLQQFIGHKLNGRSSELGSSLNKLVIRAKTNEKEPVKAMIKLINKEGVAFSSFITLSNVFTDIEIPTDQLNIHTALLLPRPYPGFQSLNFKPSSNNVAFAWSDIEKLEITIGSELTEVDFKKPYSIEIESVWLQKN